MHELFMRRCLELAEKGRGKTGTNPMVGAVLVHDKKTIAEGFHAEFGKPHAELDLIQKNEQIICSNETLYVNLEPCCHIKKKTPPCTDLIIDSGIKHVVFGMRDPNPAVSGNGIATLKKAGIEVIGPVLEDECLSLNRGFVSIQEKHRPWITLKIARTVDGRIANPDGSMMSITDAAQNVWSHECLRARHDAILVGIGTILTDDSRLTVRIPTLTPALAEARATPLPMGEGTGERGPYRIVLDPDLKIPLASRVLGDRAIVIARTASDSRKVVAIEQTGSTVLMVPCHGSSFDFNALWKVLTSPEGDFHGITSILVEGGAKTWQSFRKAGFVDREITLMGS